MTNPFADAKKQARSTAESAAIDLCKVVEVRDNAGHTARVSIRGDRDNSRVISAIVPTSGDVNVPEVGDIVAVGYAKGNKPIILGTIYTADDNIPEYEQGMRVIGHPASDATITFNTDGSIDIDGDDGSAIRVNGNPVAGSYTDEQARDAIGTALTAGTNISVTVDDPNDTITIDSTVSTYTDSDAIDAINNDADHGSTAQHDYYEDADAIDAINNDVDHGSTAQHDYYTDSDAVTAINAESSLNVDITGDADTVDGQHASDLVAVDGDQMTGTHEKVFTHPSGDGSGSDSPSAVFAGDKPPSSRLPAGDTSASLMTQSVYDDNIHANSDNSGLLTYEEAVAYAEERGGRLPTLEEVEGLATAGSGSGYDNEIIWTQTRSGVGEVYVQYGKWPNFTSDPRTTRDTYATDGTDTAVVRWVAEANQDGLPASVDYAKDQIFLATGTGTNINGNNDLSWGSADISDDAYSFDGTNVTFDEAGTYEVIAEADFTSSGASRQNPNLFIRDGSSTILGVGGRSGYMRDSEGHNRSSVHARAIVQASASDTVHVQGNQEADSGSIVPDRSQFYIKKLHR